MQGVSIFDEQGRWLWISHEPPEATDGKLIGKRVWEFTSDRDGQIVRDAFCRAHFEREPSEYRVTTAGNRTYDVRLEPLGPHFVARWREVPKKTVKLTQREREILTALCADETEKATARRLGIAVRTVESFRRSLRRKTGARGNAGLILWAIQQGICGG